MELIPYSQFAKLRLREFVGKDVEVFESDGFEWMGGYWIHEGIRGADFARWEQTPDDLGGFEICFADLSSNTINGILKAVLLPLRPGMTFDKIQSTLGVPDKTDAPVAEWNNYDFTIGKQHPYYLSCTVDHAKGLTALALIRKDVLSKIEAEEAAFQAELEAEQSDK